MTTSRDIWPWLLGTGVMAFVLVMQTSYRIGEARGRSEGDNVPGQCVCACPKVDDRTPSPDVPR